MMFPQMQENGLRDMPIIKRLLADGVLKISIGLMVCWLFSHFRVSMVSLKIVITMASEMSPLAFVWATTIRVSSYRPS